MSISIYPIEDHGLKLYSLACQYRDAGSIITYPPMSWPSILAKMSELLIAAREEEVVDL